MNIEIRDSVIRDVTDLGSIIREADRKECLRLGYKARNALYFSFKKAIYRKTALLDNYPVAMWGVCGVPMGLTGQPYLITGEGIEQVPITFAKIYRKEVQIMASLFPVLENYVDAEYEGAVRMLEMAGFTLSDPIEYNGNLFYKFTLRSE